MTTSHQSHHPADRWYIISEDKPENHINYITIHIPFAVLNNITEFSNFSRIRTWNGKKEISWETRLYTKGSSTLRIFRSNWKSETDWLILLTVGSNGSSHYSQSNLFFKTVLNVTQHGNFESGFNYFQNGMGGVTENRDARSFVDSTAVFLFFLSSRCHSRVKRVQHSRIWWIIKNEKAFELIKINPIFLKWQSICHVWMMLFYGLLSVISQQSQNYEGNKPSHKLVEKFCKTERIIAEKCCKCIALTEWHVFYIRDDLSIIQEYLKKNNNFKWYDHDAILHSVHSRNPSLSISFSRQTKSKNLLL